VRTTLTIDDDVAVEIETLRQRRDVSLKDVVNEALRKGLREIQRPPRKRKPFRTRPIEGVVCLLSNLDNVAEVLAIVEGELYK
jgi:hypothetical protein